MSPGPCPSIPPHIHRDLVTNCWKSERKWDLFEFFGAGRGWWWIYGGHCGLHQNLISIHHNLITRAWNIDSDWWPRHTLDSSLVGPCLPVTVSSDYAHWTQATHAACYQTCTGLFVGKEETELGWSKIIRNTIYARARQTPHWGCDVLLFIWSHSRDASMLHVQGQKNSVQVQRRACRGRDVFVKNNHVRKNLIVAASAKYTLTLCDSISSALALPDRSHFSSHYEVCSSVGEGGI